MGRSHCRLDSDPILLHSLSPAPWVSASLHIPSRTPISALVLAGTCTCTGFACVSIEYGIICVRTRSHQDCISECQADNCGVPLPCTGTGFLTNKAPTNKQATQPEQQEHHGRTRQLTEVAEGLARQGSSTHLRLHHQADSLVVTVSTRLRSP